MATKRPDKGHDSTMELSVSQLVVPSRKPPPATRNNPNNDMSTWGQVVVGTDQFAPPESKPAGPRLGGATGKTKWIAIGLGIAAAGVAGYLVVANVTGGDKPAGTSAANSASPSATATATSASARAADTSGTAAAASATSVDAGAGAADTSGSAAGTGAAAGMTGSAADASAPAAGTATTSAGATATTPAGAVEVDAISGVGPIEKSLKKKKKRSTRKITKKSAKKTKRR